MYYNQRTGQKQRFSRIVRDARRQARGNRLAPAAGDIVAVLGVDCASGDTYAAERKYCTLESMFVAEPVIKMAINPLTRDGADKLGKALQRFRREDPTFRVTTDEETGETVIAGMGELHLEIYVERIRREYKVEVEVGAPKVSYREAPTQDGRVQLQAQEANRRFGPVRPHRRQARMPARRLPKTSSSSKRTSSAGAFPRNTFPAVEKGFRESIHKGPVAGFPIVGVKAILEDGSYHEVDSSDMAFQICAQNCFRETFLKTKPVLLEPVMKIEIEVPTTVPGPGGRRT